MKAHKDNTHTRIALLEQSSEYTIASLQDIKYQIQILSNDIKLEFKSERSELKEGFDELEQRFEKMDNKIDAVRKDMSLRFDKSDQRFDKIENRIYNVLFAFCVSVVSYVTAKFYHFI